MHGQDANLDLKQWMGFAENLGVATGGKPAGLHPNETAAQEFLPLFILYVTHLKFKFYM